MLIVGPNNSGKTRALQEIEQWYSHGPSPEQKVIASVEVTPPATEEEVCVFLGSHGIQEPELALREGHPIGIVRPAVGGESDREGVHLPIDTMRDALVAGNSEFFRATLGKFAVLRLDGLTRLTLLSGSPGRDPAQSRGNPLGLLFYDLAARQRVSDVVMNAVGRAFVVDPSAMQQFRVRLPGREPDSTIVQSLSPEARDFFEHEPLIHEFGDGVRAFVGLIAIAVCSAVRVILVDDAEAFLHPPLARRLGADLCRIVKDAGATLIAATHSPEFLLGCVEASPDVTVVRLTYAGSPNTATARVLVPDDIRSLSRDPLLRTADSLRALFHRAAVVTESDNDRAFYDEANRRLVRDGRGIKDAAFLQAQNEQTISRILGPLRKSGLPVAAILDFDFLSADDTTWSKLLAACEVGDGEAADLGRERSSVVAALSRGRDLDTAKLAMKAQGLSALAGKEAEAAQCLLGRLAAHGIFVVPHGELETWLPQLGIRGKKRDWLVNVLTRIGSSEADDGYVRPSSDDVWAFLDSIGDWARQQGV